MSKRSLPASVGTSITEKEANENGRLSLRQTAAVVGIPYDQYMAEFHRQRGNTPDGQEFSFTLPRAWVRRGRARAASTGVADFAHQIQVLDLMDTPDGRWVDRNGAIWTRTGTTGKGTPMMSTAGSTTSGPQSYLTAQQAVTLFGPLHLLGMRVGDL